MEIRWDENYNQIAFLKKLIRQFKKVISKPSIDHFKILEITTAKCEGGVILLKDFRLADFASGAITFLAVTGKTHNEKWEMIISELNNNSWIISRGFKVKHFR